MYAIRKLFRDHDAVVVDWRTGLERHAGREPTSHWIGLGDGAWCQHGEDGIHAQIFGETKGMRGDRIGLRPIGEVQSGTGRAGIKVGDIDGLKSIWEHDTGVVARHAGLERDAERELTSHWIDFSYNARGQHEEDGIHVPGSEWAHGIRDADVVDGRAGFEFDWVCEPSFL